MASAATVDVLYKFRTDYSIDCELTCEESGNFREGDFEVRLGYRNVSRKRLSDLLDGTKDQVRITYGGGTTADISTPIGRIAFQSVGGGGQDVTFLEEGPFVDVFETISFTLEPDANFMFISGVNISDKNASLSLGRDGLSFRPTGNYDSPVLFRLENELGTFITGEFQVDLQELNVSISDVPLPATAPLLFAGLGLLGWRARKPWLRSRDSVAA